MRKVSGSWFYSCAQKAPRLYAKLTSLAMEDHLRSPGRNVVIAETRLPYVSLLCLVLAHLFDSLVLA